MMWLLLFGLTAVCVVAPMLPALREWRRPTDVAPLHIDGEDALDPPFLAQAFAARLATATARGERRLDGVELAAVPAQGEWPLADDERRRGVSTRIWAAAGDAVLPADTRFNAVVAAAGTLLTAPGSRCGALWSGARLRLAQRTTVRHWAHGRHVTVAAGCRLRGRVTADVAINITGRCRFGLLHAPALRFEPLDTRPLQPAAPPPAGDDTAWPANVRREPLADRVTCDAALTLADDSSWAGDLVGHDNLQLGRGCTAHGSVKARGNLATGPDCAILGSLVAEGCIVLGERSQVRGSVVSEEAITLGAGCVVGTPQRPATVAAPVIDIGPGVVVHGTLWAARSGRSGGAPAHRGERSAGGSSLPSARRVQLRLARPAPQRVPA